MSEDKIRAYYDQARALFPLLPRWYEYVTDGVTPECRGINSAGLAIFSVPENYTLQPSEGYHEAGHVYLALLRRAHPERDYLADYWTHRGFPGTWQTAAEMSLSQNAANAQWMYDPRESWAEAFANAVAGVWVGEKTLDYGKTIAPLKSREFFQALSPVTKPSAAIVTTVSAPIENTQPPNVVVDYYSPKGAEFMACLRENGVSGIARYLVEHPMLDVRALTPSEVAAAHGAGLSVHMVFEMNPTYREYFTAQQGSRDAASAMNHLDILGAPRGLTVYFAVDAPASVIHPESLDQYFNAIEGTLQWEAKGSRDPNDWRLWPGIYGFEAHVEYARKNFPNVGRTR